MLIDLLILFPLIGFGLLGFRDGSVRKLVAIAVSIIAMFVGHFFMQDVGKILIERIHTQPADAPMTAFFMIFFILFFLQSVIYRFLAKNYKIGGIIDRVVGCALGVAEGILVISIVIMILTLQGPPSRKTVRDSRLYAPIVSVAPVIKDFLSNFLPSAQETIQDFTKPGASKVDSSLQKARE